MAARRASSRARFSAASMVPPDEDSEASGALHSGQRLAKPGLSGLSSNSSSQTAQILIGNGMQNHFTTLKDKGVLTPDVRFVGCGTLRVGLEQITCWCGGDESFRAVFPETKRR